MTNLDALIEKCKQGTPKTEDEILYDVVFYFHEIGRISKAQSEHLLKLIDLDGCESVALRLLPTYTDQDGEHNYDYILQHIHLGLTVSCQLGSANEVYANTTALAIAQACLIEQKQTTEKNQN